MLGRKLPLAQDWPPFMRTLIDACCATDPSLRPPFTEVEALLRQEAERVSQGVRSGSHT
jgi:hypothetical protein